MAPDKRAYGILAVLFALWLILSGHYQALLISFGIISCVLVTWIRTRMDSADGERNFGSIGVIATARYLGWLTVEVIKSNLDVSRRILSPKLPISPTVIRVPASQKTEIGRVIFANSITLTPGTVSMDVREGEIEVHALSREAAAGLMQGEMDRRIRAIEGES